MTLRWIVVGGAPLPNRAYLKLKALGVQPLGGYGLTETTALFSVAALDDPHPGSAGRCCHGFGGMEARVSPEGVLQLRGPAVLKGYYKEPEKTAAVRDGDGWFSTGDYGRIDADGYVWITGRASRTIILSSGKKVAPEELEDTAAIRSRQVVDQVLPVPYSLAESDWEADDWSMLKDVFGNEMALQRRHPAIRANVGAAFDEAATLTYNARLVGRSVWNDQWYVFIPAASLNADDAAAKAAFLESVRDIHLSLRTYSMSGN